MLKVLFFNVTPLNDNSVFEYFYRKMSDYRRKKTDRYYRQEDRNLSIGAGIITDTFLSDAGLQEKNMQYIENESGKPYFKGRNNLFFNLSHSGVWAMGAFSDSETGCDIEADIQPAEDIADLVLSEDENKKDLIRIWTMKESYLKFKGCGLIKPMSSFSVKGLDIVHEIDIIDGYCASVCSVERDLHDCHIVKLSSVSGELKAF